MGGAERSARKRRQEQLAAQAAKPGAKATVETGERTKKLVIAGAAVLLVVAVVIGGLLWMDARKNATEGVVIPARRGAERVEEVRDGVVIVIGAKDAPATIDVYADFLCPACRAFEEANGADIAEHVSEGELRVRTHLVPFLVNLSDPPGYSLDAANAGLCAADAGKFTAFHDSLFAAQPDEGARGYDKGQLINLGKDVGITDSAFANCVQSGRYDNPLTTEFTETTQRPELRQDFGDGPIFVTPTIVADGEIVDWSKGDWLTSVIKSARG